MPGERPGDCLSCGLDRPTVNGRCDLCQAAFGPAGAPEHIREILPRVVAFLRRRAS